MISLMTCRWNRQGGLLGHTSSCRWSLNGRPACAEALSAMSQYAATKHVVDPSVLEVAGASGTPVECPPPCACLAGLLHDQAAWLRVGVRALPCGCMCVGAHTMRLSGWPPLPPTDHQKTASSAPTGLSCRLPQHYNNKKHEDGVPR